MGVLCCEGYLAKVDIGIVIKYRCPKASFSFFLDEYVLLVSHYLLQFELCLIIGDPNVPVNKTNHEFVALLSSMEELGFYKHSSVPTHVKGNEIDLVFSNHNACTFAQVDKSLTSDHFCVTFKINLSLTIEPLWIKQQREKWMCDRSEYHSIFDLIIFHTNKKKLNRILYFSPCLVHLNILPSADGSLSIVNRKSFMMEDPDFLMLIVKEKRS